MQSNYPEYMTTREAEDYSGIKGLAKRRVLGSDFTPPYIKLGSGSKNHKVLYARKAIDEWLAARTRKSTSENPALTQAAAGA